MKKEAPPPQPPYTVPVKLRKALQNALDEQVRLGILEPGTSPYGSPVLVVEKKGTDKVRIVADYRKLYQSLNDDLYPMPNIEIMLQKLHGAKVFSKCDFSNAFYQIRTSPESAQLCAINTHMGQFLPRRVPQGLKVSPGISNRKAHGAFQKLEDDGVEIYVDDVIVHSPNADQQLNAIDKMLKTAIDNNFKLDPKKCEFFCKKLEFLGHVISEEGISPNPRNVQAVQRFPEPKNPQQIKQFLALAGYYRKFIKDYSHISKSLNDLTKKEVKFKFTEEHRAHFNILKERLTSAPVLAQPDFSKPFILWTDASAFAYGAVLTQKGEDGKTRAISFYSKLFDKSQLNYTTTEREMCAVIMALRRYRPLIYLCDVTVLSDHIALVHFVTIKHLLPRLSRWAAELSAWPVKFGYIDGENNEQADTMSRLVTQVPCYNIAAFDKQNDPDIIWDLDEVRKLQTQDEKIMALIGGKDNFIRITDTGVRYKTKHGEFQVTTALYRCKNRHYDSWELVIPEKLVLRLLNDLHSSKWAGHRSYERTLYIMEGRYYWPTMKRDTKDYIQMCHFCQAFKTNKRLKLSRLTPFDREMAKFYMVSMDVFGPISPTGSTGSKYVLLLVDAFTKAIILAPLRDLQSATVANALVVHLFLEHGCPKTIISDRASYFLSDVMQKVYAALGVKHSPTTAGHQQANGLAERAIGTCKMILKTIVEQKPEEWEENLPFVKFAYMTTRHASTGKTPFSLLYEREPLLPNDLYDARRTRVYYDWDWNYSRMMQHRVRLAKEAVIKTLTKQEKSYATQFDKRAAEKPLTLGALVYRPAMSKRLPGTSEFFRAQYDGPWEITDFSGVNVAIRSLANRKKVDVVHPNRLKLIKDIKIYKNELRHISSPVTSDEEPELREYESENSVDSEREQTRKPNKVVEGWETDDNIRIVSSSGEESSDFYDRSPSEIEKSRKIAEEKDRLRPTVAQRQNHLNDRQATNMDGRFLPFVHRKVPGDNTNQDAGTQPVDLPALPAGDKAEAPDPSAPAANRAQEINLCTPVEEQEQESPYPLRSRGAKRPGEIAEYLYKGRI